MLGLTVNINLVLLRNMTERQIYLFGIFFVLPSDSYAIAFYAKYDKVSSHQIIPFTCILDMLTLISKIMVFFWSDNRNFQIIQVSFIKYSRWSL